jgi:cytochrome c peroxidase
MKIPRWPGAILAVLAVAGGAGGVAANDDARLGLPAAATPVVNEQAAARIELGRRLFFEPQLAEDGVMACATCHIPEHAFTVNAGTVAFGRGGQALRRNSPTLLNAELASTFFHDGRAGTLEEQVWFPLLSQSEMWNPSAESVVGRLRYRRDYAELFRRAFGDEGVTRKNIAVAIAAYERTLVAAGSRFDRWFYGKQADALTVEEQAGFTVFNWSGCNACHTVDAMHATFTDNRFRNTGVEWARIGGELGPKKTDPDLGRFEISGRPEDRHAFRTPSLRNVALTAPYMHDGSLQTLREVVEWYDRGGSRDPGKDPMVRPLRLSEAQKRQLEAFLRSLTSDNVATLARTARIGSQ